MLSTNCYENLSSILSTNQCWYNGKIMLSCVHFKRSVCVFQCDRSRVRVLNPCVYFCIYCAGGCVMPQGASSSSVTHKQRVAVGRGSWLDDTAWWDPLRVTPLAESQHANKIWFLHAVRAGTCRKSSHQHSRVWQKLVCFDFLYLFSSSIMCYWNMFCQLSDKSIYFHYIKLISFLALNNSFLHK